MIGRTRRLITLPSEAMNGAIMARLPPVDRPDRGIGPSIGPKWPDSDAYGATVGELIEPKGSKKPGIPGDVPGCERKRGME